METYSWAVKGRTFFWASLCFGESHGRGEARRFPAIITRDRLTGSEKLQRYPLPLQTIRLALVRPNAKVVLRFSAYCWVSGWPWFAREDIAWLLTGVLLGLSNLFSAYSEAGGAASAIWPNSICFSGNQACRCACCFSGCYFPTFPPDRARHGRLRN